MKKEEDVRGLVRKLVFDHFLVDPSGTVGDDESLLGSGLVDSVGIVTLIGILEERFKIHFFENEMLAENFDSISRLSDSVIRKLHQEHRERDEAQ